MNARTIYVGGFEVYREYTAAVSGPALERESLHVTDDKLRIVVVDTKTIENGALLATLSPVQRYQLANHLGSATLELDDQADLISYEEYYPYGASSFQVARSGTEVPAKRYRYTAKERDEESGLYYHGARYYAPWLARWVSCDRAAMIDGTNLYAYARDNPLLYFDPKGTQVQGATNDLIDQSTAAEEEFAATAEAESFAGTLSSTAPPGTGASSLSRTFVPGQTSSSASGVSAQSPTNRTLDSTRLIPSWALVAADPKVTDLERWNAPTWQARHPSDMGDALGELATV